MNFRLIVGKLNNTPIFQTSNNFIDNICNCKRFDASFHFCHNIKYKLDKNNGLVLTTLLRRSSVVNVFFCMLIR